jgi:transglutaminase-like putative cysteine protease
MSTVYLITHRTDYSYEKPVSSSYGQLHMLPRELPTQHCTSSSVDFDPRPELYRERIDFFGNRAAYFALHEPHRHLSVKVTSVVEVKERAAELSLFGHQRWEDVRDVVAAGGDNIPHEAVQHLLDSPRVAAADVYREYASTAFTPGQGVFEAVAALCSQIHNDFEYKPGSTSVTTTLAKSFASRRGVCQDFAHVAIACLRSLGLPARYVSGYLETDPPPGRPKLTGADGSHAWLSVFIPEAGWVDVDPTNDQFVGDRYITTAIGRDYGDVPPMNGVIYTTGKTEKLDVAVDVTVVEPELTPLSAT